jgi:hypothetical protein
MHSKGTSECSHPGNLKTLGFLRSSIPYLCNSHTRSKAPAWVITGCPVTAQVILCPTRSMHSKGTSECSRPGNLNTPGFLHPPIPYSCNSHTQSKAPAWVITGCPVTAQVILCPTRSMHCKEVSECSRPGNLKTLRFLHPPISYSCSSHTRSKAPAWVITGCPVTAQVILCPTRSTHCKGTSECSHPATVRAKS